MIDRDDILHRFLLERPQLRGVLVRLTATWNHVRERADYPPVIADLLARSLVATALFTGNIKFEGSLSIQIKAAGALSLLFAECGHDGRLRGLARWRPELRADFRLSATGGALLAITIENAAAGGQRYQGVVPCDGDDLAALFERYFERSEQLPTRVLLAFDGDRCAGLMLQQLPGAGTADADAWNRAGHLLATLSPHELLELDAERLLLRLFHEESVRLLAEQPLRFGCRCTRERVAGVLRTLGREEALASVQADGRVEVTCEFCNTRYYFDAVDIEQIFRDPAGTPSSATEH